jgi:hypothetical protein
MKEADITPLIVSSVPFLGGCLALLMTVGLYLRVLSSLQPITIPFYPHAPTPAVSNLTMLFNFTPQSLTAVEFRSPACATSRLRLVGAVCYSVALLSLRIVYKTRLLRI